MQIESVKFPHIFVPVADGAPIAKIIERTETKMRNKGVSAADLNQFRKCVPSTGYAMTVDEIRKWVDTD